MLRWAGLDRGRRSCGRDGVVPDVAADGAAVTGAAVDRRARRRDRSQPTADEGLEMSPQQLLELGRRRVLVDTGARAVGIAQRLEPAPDCVVLRPLGVEVGVVEVDARLLRAPVDEDRAVGRDRVLDLPHGARREARAVGPRHRRRQRRAEPAPQHDDRQVAVGRSPGPAIDRALRRLARIEWRAGDRVVPSDDDQVDPFAQQRAVLERAHRLDREAPFLGDVPGRRQEHLQRQHAPDCAGDAAPARATGGAPAQRHGFTD